MLPKLPPSTSSQASRGVGVSFTPIITCSPRLSAIPQSHGHPGSNITCPRLWNPWQMCITSLGSIMLLPSLSWFPISSVCFGTDFDELSQVYKQCRGLVRHHVYLTPNGPVLLCDYSSGSRRLVNPSHALHRAFDLLHCLSHLGICTSQHLVGDRFIWFGMHCISLCGSHRCHSCHSNKVTCHQHSLVLLMPVPEKSTHIHVDLIRPMPSSNGYA